MRGDHDSINALLDRVLRDQDGWKTLVLYDQGRQIYPSVRTGIEMQPQFMKLHYVISHLDKTVGAVELVFDPQVVLSKARTQVYRLELILFALFGVSALISVFIQDKWIRAPLLNLAAAAKRLANGDTAVKLPSVTHDEMGELVFAFRTMSQSLQLTYLNLQDELQQAQESAVELAESEQRFRTVLNSIADPLITIDEHGVICNVNPATTKILGYQSEELEGGLVNLIMPSPHRENHDAYLAAYNSGKGAGVVDGTPREVAALCKDGRELPVEISVSEFIVGGRRHFIGALRDISVHKHLRERLQAEKEMAQNYLQTASVMMIAIDPAGKIMLVNEKGCEVLGYTEANLLDKNWFECLFYEDVAGELAAEYQRVVQGQNFFPEYFECQVKAAGNETRIVVWHTNIIRDPSSGATTGLLASGEDITESRASEATRKLLQRQLQQSQKMEAIGQLTGGIAHDFNNMLASIMGYSELSMLKAEQYNDDKLKGYVAQIYESGQRARDLVGKMLAFSRGKDGELPQPLHLNAVIKELLPMLQSVIPASVQIQAELNEQLPAVLADTIDIQQIVMNLCINGRDAMQGRGKIVIGTRIVSITAGVCSSCHKSFDGEYVELAIEDTGPGIPAGDLVKLFQPFYTTKAVGKGSGLGLSIIHGVVHARSGHIIVHSESGKGSRFSILFNTQLKSAVGINAHGLKDELQTVLLQPASTNKQRASG